VRPERIEQLRSGIHQLSSGEVPTVARKQYINQLGASIAQVGSINSVTVARLEEEPNLAMRKSRQ
jgi:hypothetical protein